MASSNLTSRGPPWARVCGSIMALSLSWLPDHLLPQRYSSTWICSYHQPHLHLSNSFSRTQTMLAWWPFCETQLWLERCRGLPGDRPSAGLDTWHVLSFFYSPKGQCFDAFKHTYLERDRQKHKHTHRLGEVGEKDREKGERHTETERGERERWKWVGGLLASICVKFVPVFPLPLAMCASSAHAPGMYFSTDYKLHSSFLSSIKEKVSCEISSIINPFLLNVTLLPVAREPIHAGVFCF